MLVLSALCSCFDKLGMRVGRSICRHLISLWLDLTLSLSKGEIRVATGAFQQPAR